MASPVALLPSVPLQSQPLPISTPILTTSPPHAATSGSPTLSHPGRHPFGAEHLQLTDPPSAAPQTAHKPVYATPSPVENTPENNVCRMVNVKGAQLACFTVEDTELLCLPQAFDLFLKHLVGGLHTVYTKLKRLDLSPVVCNVEQVRVLRGLGAIQPGVNRCKLISRKDFETLYNDCTTTSSRPGRPPKRHQSGTSSECAHIMPFSMSGLTSSPGDMPPVGISSLAKKIKLEMMGVYRGNHQPTRPDSDNRMPFALVKKHYSTTFSFCGPPGGLDKLPFMMMSHPLLPGGLAPASVSMAMGQMSRLSALANMATGVQLHGNAPNDLSPRALSSVIKERVQDSPSPSFKEGQRSSNQSCSSSRSPSHPQHSSLSSCHARLGHSPSTAPGPREGDIATLDPDHQLTERTHVDREEESHRTQPHPGTEGSDMLAHPGREGHDRASYLGSNPLSPGDGETFQNLPLDSDGWQFQNIPPGTQGSDQRSFPSQRPSSPGRPGCIRRQKPPSFFSLPPPLYPEGLSSIESLLANIQQGLLRVAIDSTRAQDKQVQMERTELKMELIRERDLRETLERQLSIEQENRVLVHKRWKKERRSKKRLQEALEEEVKLRDQAEHTLLQTHTDSMTQEVDEAIELDGNRDDGRTESTVTIKERRANLTTAGVY
ncbi:dachshund c [Aplochiton taeniatus]